MRKMNIEKKLLATLLALAMLLCSFPAVFAEDAEAVAEEATVEVQEVMPEPEAEEIPEEEPAEEPETEEIPAEEPAEDPEVEEIPAEELAVEPETEEIPAEEPAEEPEAEEIPAEEPAVEPEAEEIPAEDPAEEPEAEEIPAEEPAVEPETEEIPAEEPAAEPEAEEIPAEDPAGEDEELIEIEDDDSGSVSEELLEEFNNPETYEAAEFDGNVEIEMKNSEIRYGGEVTLVAKVSGVAMNHRIVWEANDGDGRGWFTVGSGPEYTFTVTPDVVNREYRVSLFTVD